MVWDPKVHPRWPKGTPKPPGAGTFMDKSHTGTPAWAAAVSKQMGAPPTPKAGKSTPRPVKAAKATVAATTPGNPTIKSAVTPKVSTDAELDTRAKKVDRAVSGAADSSSLHHQGGRWSTARSAQHQQIVADLLARASAIPNDRKAVIAGGMSGAGKGSVLGQTGIAGQYMTLDPDEIKAELAARGMVPAVPGHADLSPLERAGLVHAESMHVVEMLAQAAYAQGKNVVWDTTMHNGGATVSRVADLRKAGYHTVHGVFVDVPFATGVARVQARYRAGQREYEQGRGQGGRFIPTWALAGYASGKSTVARQNWPGLRRQFDSWELWDNSGAAPVLTGQG